MTAEIPDKSNEVSDYGDTKKLYQRWSNEMLKATEGAGQEPSLGNVRLQHTLEIAGKLTSLDFDDANKAIMAGAQPVDDRIWKMIKMGFITGFSHGGSYVYRRCNSCGTDIQGENDNFHCESCKCNVQVRYAARPSEISFVDNPCLEAAHFTFVKSDGSSEQVKITGKETGGDGGLNRQRASSKSTNGRPAKVKKGLYSINQMTDILASAAYLKRSLESDGSYENDEGDYEIARQVQSWLTEGSNILKDIVDHEVAELTAVIKAAKKGEATMNDLEKAARASLVTHFKRAAQHNEEMAGCFKAILEQNEAMEETESGKEQPDKAVKSYYRAMANHCAKMAKACESYSGHCAKMQSAHEDATKVMDDKTEAAPVTKAATTVTAPDTVPEQNAGTTEPDTPKNIQKVISAQVNDMVLKAFTDSLGRVSESESIRKMVDDAVVAQMQASIGTKVEPTAVKVAGPTLVSRSGAVLEKSFDPEDTGL